MNSSESKEEPLFKAESQHVINCALEVHRALGHGFHEKPYENALVVEFGLRGIPCRQQSRFDILYKDHPVGVYIPDLIVYDKIIVDTKVIDAVTDFEMGQMLNYLKITGLQLGYILNFKHARLLWKRVIRSTAKTNI